MRTWNTSLLQTNNDSLYVHVEDDADYYGSWAVPLPQLLNFNRQNIFLENTTVRILIKKPDSPTTAARDPVGDHYSAAAESGDTLTPADNRLDIWNTCSGAVETVLHAVQELLVFQTSPVL